jgi:hypothetical protein
MYTVVTIWPRSCSHGLGLVVGFMLREFFDCGVAPEQRFFKQPTQIKDYIIFMSNLCGLQFCLKIVIGSGRLNSRYRESLTNLTLKEH